MGKEGVEGNERRDVDGMVGVDGERLMWEGAHAQVDSLVSVSVGLVV